MLNFSTLTQSSFAENEHVDAGEGNPRRRKRNRKVLVCQPCHRHKQKCDKNQPCSRCIAAERPDQCVYEALAWVHKDWKSTSKGSTHAGSDQVAPANANGEGGSGSPGSKSASPSIHSSKAVPKRTTVMRYADGEVSVSSATHWAHLIHQFEEMRPFMQSQVRSQSDSKMRTTSVKSFFPPYKKRAFPFGDTAGSVSYCESMRLSYLPARATTETLVDYYLDTFNMVFPLVEASTFRDELATFYNGPHQATNSWLAQLYMVLVLACYTNPRFPPEELPVDPTRLADRLMDGAEAVFTQTSFFVRPDLTSLTVLCMIAISKRMDIVTHMDAATCWPFMGLVIRQAMSMWLHRNPDVFETMPKSEAETRKRLWATVALLDLQVSIDQGKQPQCGPEDFDPLVPSATSISADENVVYYQRCLMKLLPTLSGIIKKLNSPSPDMEYDQVLEIDALLREMLKSVESLAVTANPLSLGWMQLQEMMLGNMIRRVRLAVHQPWAKEASQDPNYQASHWTVLECGLGILRHHQYLFDDTRLRWASQLFALDFKLSTIHVCLGLRQKHFSDKPESGSEKSAKDVAWESVRVAQAIVKYNLHQSIENLKAFVGISNMIAMLEALEPGTPFDPMEVFKTATTEALDAVEERMKSLPQADTPEEPKGTGEESMDWSSSASGNGSDGYGVQPWMLGGMIDPALGGLEYESADFLAADAFIARMLPR